MVQDGTGDGHLAFATDLARNRFAGHASARQPGTLITMDQRTVINRAVGIAVVLFALAIAALSVVVGATLLRNQRHRTEAGHEIDA